MSKHSVTIVLTGPRERFTGKLGNHEFAKGRTTIEGTIPAITTACKNLARYYGGYPEGSSELEHARAKYAETNAKNREEADRGKRDLRRGSQPKLNPEVPTRVQPDGPGPAEISDDDGDAGGDPETSPAGPVAEGNGLPNAGNDPVVPDDLRHAVSGAIAVLDPENDEHWTADGLPAVAAVSDLARRSVSRQAITAVAPDFTRERALEIATNPQN